MGRGMGKALRYMSRCSVWVEVRSVVAGADVSARLGCGYRCRLWVQVWIVSASL